MEAFAVENKKTPKQVREAFSFVVGRRIFGFCDDEGEGGGGNGRARGRGKVARRFEREMREDRCVCVFLFFHLFPFFIFYFFKFFICGFWDFVVFEYVFS